MRPALRAVLLTHTPYYRCVLRTRPIAYWPQWDASGARANDISGNARNGAYTGVDLGQAGIGDGHSCPWFDGTNDYNNIYSAGLAAAFSGAEGSLMVWAKVNAAAVWTDGVRRYQVVLRADDSNRVFIRKGIVNNSIEIDHVAAATTKQVTLAAMTTTDFFVVALTWSVTDNAMRAYLNGAQSGTTQTSLGTWEGALTTTTVCVGAGNTSPGNVWHGWLAHVGAWDRALSPAEVAALARAR